MADADEDMVVIEALGGEETAAGRMLSWRRDSGRAIWL
jgi:hypothetical protein